MNQEQRLTSRLMTGPVHGNAQSRVRHFPLHSMKIKRAARALRAKRKLEAIERALDFVIAEHQKNCPVLEAP